MFEGILEDNSCQVERFLLVGDFNINYNSTDFYCIKFKNMINVLGIEQVVTDCTRCCNYSRTLIDYVLTNKSNVKAYVFDEPKITDHSLIGISLSDTKMMPYNKSKIILSRSINSDHFYQINLGLLECAWDNDSTDVDVLYCEISQKVNILVNTLCPVKEILNKNVYAP